MNLAELQAKLIAAARSNPPSDAVPYAFEKRIMARLAGASVEDRWMLWGRELWRGAAVSVALAVLLGAWSLWPAHDPGSATLESTVFAAAEQMSEAW